MSLFSPPPWVFPTISASTWLGELFQLSTVAVGIGLTAGFSNAAGYAWALDHDRWTEIWPHETWSEYTVSILPYGVFVPEYSSVKLID